MGDDTEAQGAERRRAARVNTRLLTRIAGVDASWVARRCNLSLTGMLLEVDASIGEPGSVQQVRLLSLDRAHTVAVLARLVRTLTTPDLWRGKVVAGVALDFLVQTPENRDAIAELLRQALRAQDAPQAVAPLGLVPAALEPSGTAQIQAIGFEGMVLRASSPLTVGAQLRCQIQPVGSGQYYRLQGEVLRSAPLPAAGGQGPRYEMEIRFGAAPGAAERPTGLNINDAIDALLEEAVFQSIEPGPTAAREQLSGMLARIRLPSLLSFMEMERLSGTLSLAHGHEQGTLYLRAGQVVDCEMPGQTAAVPALQQLLAWSEGEFQFRMNSVERPDVVQMSTTHLLLKLTTEAEQAAAPGGHV